MAFQVDRSQLAHLPPYQYDGFNDKSSIRVLTLYPSRDPQGTINVRLDIKPLTEDLDFEALSYTWGTLQGDYSLSSTVVCEGCAIKVTKNCEEALQKLRFTATERVLWVDAICINQNDNAEKSHQVAAMGKIYTSASRAVIWVGAASEKSDDTSGLPISDIFFDYCRHMASEIRDMKARGENPMTCAKFKALIAYGADLVTTRRSNSLLDGFLEVIHRPWWTRVWVVQEATLARSAIVLCGDQQIDHADIVELWDLLENDPSHDNGLTYSLLDGFKHHMYAFNFVRERIATFGPAKTLQHVLDRCRRLQSTDRRDRIYAMLGMFGDFQRDLPKPNYGTKAHGLFAEMTVKFLRLNDNFRILAQATNVKDDPSNPSWAVDFSQKPQFHIPSRDYYYQPSKHGSTRHFEVSDDFRYLKVAGRLVDTIEYLPKAPIEGYHHPYLPQKAILGYQQNCRVGSSLSTYPTGEDLEEVLWRTMCWDVDVEYKCPAPSRIRKSFDQFKKSLLSGKDVASIEPELLKEDAHEFNDICVHSMPLCLTSRGLLGSVPWTAEQGDQMVIFSGSELPFVLRKDKLGDHYRFVGSCYVRGIMHGELFTDAEDGEDLEWFSLR